MSDEIKNELVSVKVRLLDAQDSIEFLKNELNTRDKILNDLIAYANVKFETEKVTLEDVHRALVDVIQPLGDTKSDVVDAEIVE